MDKKISVSDWLIDWLTDWQTDWQTFAFLELYLYSLGWVTLHIDQVETIETRSKVIIDTVLNAWTIHNHSNDQQHQKSFHSKIILQKIYSVNITFSFPTLFCKVHSENKFSYLNWESLKSPVRKEWRGMTFLQRLCLCNLFKNFHILLLGFSAVSKYQNSKLRFEILSVLHTKFKLLTYHKLANFKLRFD